MGEFSELFKKMKDNKKNKDLDNILSPFLKFMVLWDWENFGVSFLIFKNTKFSDYSFSIDIQILWFNLWTQVWRKY